MNKFAIIFLAAALFPISSVSGFAPRQPSFIARTSTKIETTSQLQAAPTMVIYWTIKSAIDYAGYATGKTDEWKGTGVWSGLSVKRDEGSNDEEGPTKKDNSPSNEKEKTPKSS